MMNMHSFTTIVSSPILAGGDTLTLSALYRIKSPEFRQKVGVMGYQNSSWNTCDLTKWFRVQKCFKARPKGPAKFVRRKI